MNYAIQVSVSLGCIKRGFNYQQLQHLHVCKHSSSVPKSLPHPFSHPCPGLTTNGLSKWPIAESLCNCVIRFHTFQSSNPIRMCRCALRFMCSPACARDKNKKQSKNGFLYFIFLHVQATRVEAVLNETLAEQRLC